MRLVMKCASRGSLPFIKMLYPRKIDEVLWHSATRRVPKSIFVKIPRLPTMRVIGSQFIWTRFFLSIGVSFIGVVIVLIVNAPLDFSVAARAIAGGQFRPWMAPLRFFVDRLIRETAQRAYRTPINPDRSGRHLRARRFIHKWHELVRESRHGAADANSTDVRATAEAIHPAALRHIAIHHRAPAAELHDALRRAVLFREIALLVIAGAIAAFVNRLAEKPQRTQLVIERNHWCEASDLIQEVK